MNLNPKQKIEIAHDILAREAYARIDATEKMRLKITQFLHDRYDYYREAGALLSKKDLDYITPYLDKVPLSPEQGEFLRKSRKEIEARARKRRLLTVSIGIVLAALAGFASFSAYKAAIAEEEAVEERQKAVIAKEEAVTERQKADSLRAKAEVALRAMYVAEGETQAAIDSLAVVVEEAEKARKEAKKERERAQLAIVKAENLSTKSTKIQYAISEFMSSNSEMFKIINELSSLRDSQKDEDAKKIINLGISLMNSTFIEALKNSQAQLSKSLQELDLDIFWEWKRIAPEQAPPRNIVKAGKYLICRGEKSNGKHPGKLKDNKCHFGWGGKVEIVNTFDVLVLKENVSSKWINSDELLNKLNNGWEAVLGGWNTDENKKPLYVVRSKCNGEWVPGKLLEIDSGKLLSHIPCNGREFFTDKFEYLVVKRAQ